MDERIRMTTVVTGISTLINAHIWEPIVINDQPPLYTATLIIPKSDRKTIDGINLAISNAHRFGSYKHRHNHMKKAKDNTPLIDGDLDGMPPLFKNCYIINAASVVPPQIYDYKVFPITDPNTVSSGSKVRVSLLMYSYYKNGIAGIGCCLKNIQLAGSERNKIKYPDTCFDSFTKDFIRIFDADS